jgi:hypothetical protein
VQSVVLTFQCSLLNYSSSIVVTAESDVIVLFDQTIVFKLDCEDEFVLAGSHVLLASSLMFCCDEVRALGLRRSTRLMHLILVVVQ